MRGHCEQNNFHSSMLAAITLGILSWFQEKPSMLAINPRDFRARRSDAHFSLHLNAHIDNFEPDIECELLLVIVV